MFAALSAGTLYLPSCERLLARTHAGARTLFAKVRAHNSCELNAAADRLAAQGATLPTDQETFAESTRDFGLQYAKWDPVSPFTAERGAMLPLDQGVFAEHDRDFGLQ